MDKRFFKSWVLRIPHRLRDLLWMLWGWSSVAPIFSSLIWVKLLLVCTLPRVCWRLLLPSGTHSLSEWIPWSWEAIQGDYNSILFFFDCFVIASNTSFWCLQGWHMRDEIIFNRICNDSLGSSLSLISLWLLEIPYWNTDPSQFLQGSQRSYTSILEICQLHQACHQTRRD